MLDNDLREALYEAGLPLHERYVFYGTAEEQRRGLELLRELLAADALPDDALERLAPDERTTAAARTLLKLRSRPGFDDAIRKYLEGTVVSLERELAARHPLPRWHDVADRVTREVRDWQFFREDDVLEVMGGPDTPLHVNCVLRRFSPEYDGSGGAWDRDTQLMFEMAFGSGLFIWLSMHVVEQFRGQGIGTSFIKRIEGFARGMGFRRFIVPGPNPGFWCGKCGYTLHPAHRAVGGGAFLHEVYKEVAP